MFAWLLKAGEALTSLAFFFALCCLGKIPGGAPFSQLHKSGNGSVNGSRLNNFRFSALVARKFCL